MYVYVCVYIYIYIYIGERADLWRGRPGQRDGVEPQDGRAPGLHARGYHSI